jgi:hypothetical protein
MKRRQFITLVGASALAAPFLVKQLAFKPKKTAPVASRARKPMELAASADEQKVLAVLQAHSKGVYLLGGCVSGKLMKRDLPYVNLLVDTEDFAQIKKELFQIGVEPVSTPELPSSVIRFAFADKPYSVVNLPVNEYLKQNTLSSGLSLIPFAHNFLVYSFDGRWVVDPYDALSGKEQRIQLLQEPASPVSGLTCALAATLDSALLGLKESSACSRTTKRHLKKIVSTEDAPLVMEQVINYVPDVLETCGFATMQKFLLSPLAIAAGRDGAGVDLRRVNAELVAAKRKGVAIDGARLLGAMNKEFLRKDNPDGLGLGISDYMASKGFMVRRTDLLIAAMKMAEVQIAA